MDRSCYGRIQIMVTLRGQAVARAVTRHRREIPAFAISAAVSLGALSLCCFAFLCLWGCSRGQSGVISRSEPIRAKSERDKACEEFGLQHRKKLRQDDNSVAFTDFYSEKLDTCVETRESQVENLFAVVDISRGFMKGGLNLPGDMGQGLFDCDSAGVDHVLIEKVRDHRGYVWELPYTQYMDDFAGGPPRTQKSAPRMFTRKDCEEWFQKELSELR
jgi:hypothetical protein